MAVTERETPVRVLLERHLIDLQLQNAPEQYLISRVLARLVELEGQIALVPKGVMRALEHWEAM